MQISQERKLYIFTARHGLVQKRLFFDGPAGEVGEVAFGELLKTLTDIGDAAADMPTFVAAIRRRFADSDFLPAEP
jgi:hypothetical protein